MPSITIEGPPVEELDKRRRLAKEITEAMVRFYGLSAEKIHVLIKGNSPENVCAGGQLIIDRHKHNSNK